MSNRATNRHLFDIWQPFYLVSVVDTTVLVVMVGNGKYPQIQLPSIQLLPLVWVSAVDDWKLKCISMIPKRLIQFNVTLTVDECHDLSSLWMVYDHHRHWNHHGFSYSYSFYYVLIKLKINQFLLPVTISWRRKTIFEFKKNIFPFDKSQNNQHPPNNE